MADDNSTSRTHREREQARLKALSSRRPKDDRDFQFNGVLLSDAIKKCCHSFGLITPFDEQNLKPANYKLRIGDEYAIRGKIHSLSDQPGENDIVIKPFEVAIIKTLETINMPRFLIARWNIQVSKAYKGLLWVGGPQVDAGYVGNLFCPIYNLSDRTVILHYADSIAVIDFEKTSQVTGESKPYPELPERILFQDYEPESLQSGLATDVQDAIHSFRGRIDSLTSRVDSFVGITFALLGILYAAGALFLMKPDHPVWWDASVFWICALAIAFSGWAVVRSRPTGPSMIHRTEIGLWIALLVVIGGGLLWQLRLQSQVLELRNQLQRVTVNPQQNVAPPR